MCFRSVYFASSSFCLFVCLFVFSTVAYSDTLTLYANAVVGTQLTCLQTVSDRWVILLKTGQNCDIEGKNSNCEFFNAIIWK